MLRNIAIAFVAIVLSASITAAYFERSLSRQKVADAHVLLAQRTTFMDKMQEMAPKEQIEGAIRTLRNRASAAQGAIIDSYVKVYCADRSHASAQEKQEAMAVAAMLSGLAMRAGVGDVALAEYARCNRSTPGRRVSGGAAPTMPPR